MKLYLMRHAEASASMDDPRRHLTPYGYQQVEKIVSHLPAEMSSINAIYHSGILRAQETAELVAKALSLTNQLHTLSLLGENGDVDAFVSDLSVWETDTLVVSHFPFLTRLITLLLGEKCVQANRLVFSPATLLCLTKMNDQWRFDWVMAPEKL